MRITEHPATGHRDTCEVLQLSWYTCTPVFWGSGGTTVGLVGSIHVSAQLANAHIAKTQLRHMLYKANRS